MAGPPPGQWPTIIAAGEAWFVLDAPDGEGEEIYQVPAAPARLWLDALSTGDPLDIVPGMVEAADREVFLDRLYNDADPLGMATQRVIATQILADVTGLPGWTVASLVGVAGHHWWVFDGWCAERGLAPLELPFPRFLALVYTWLVSGVEKQADLDDLQRRLFDPPPGALDDVDPDDPATLPPGWRPEDQGSAWAGARRP
jgi:hypothetical protein